ncbi:FUSC family protein [Rhizobium brockwellii]|uniref:FUSC family protein n=1 Tax=Rhizobium brockwellii TaxID=3019932 RepID=UPI003F9B5ABD
MRLTSRLVSFVSRRTQWSEGQVYAVAPEQLDIVDGVRAAISIGLVLACAIGLEIPDLAFGAVAAFWTCLCDPFGRAWSRFLIMAKFAVLGAIVFSLSSFGAHFGTVAAVATLFALVALCCLGRSYVPAFGPGPAQGSFISAIAVVIGVSTPRPLDGALQLGGWFLLGGAVTIFVSTMIWPNHSNTPGRLTLVMIYSRLQLMSAALIELDRSRGISNAGWLQYETLTRRAVRIAIERGRQIVARRLLGSRPHGHAIDVGAKIFAVLIALGQYRRAGGKFTDYDTKLLGHMDETLRQLIDYLDTGPITSDQITQSASLLHAKAIESQDRVFGRCMAGAATALMSLAGTPRSEPRQDAELTSFIPVTFVKLAVPTPIVWHQALRVATAVTACHLMGIWFDITLSYWGTIATLVVMQPAFGNTWARIVERATGTILGGLFASVLLMQNPGEVVGTLMIVPLAAAVIALRTVNYAVFMIFLTPMFMLLSDIIRPSDNLILLRAINESLGAVFGIVASVLIFPANERLAIADALRAAVSANMSFAAGVRSSHTSDLTQTAKAQSEAGIRSSRAEVAAAGLGRGNVDADALTGVLSALRNVCGASAVFEILGSDDPKIDRQRADYYYALSAALEMQLRTWTVRDLPTPVADRGDALDQAVADLALALQLYIEMYGRRKGSAIPI